MTKLKDWLGEKEFNIEMPKEIKAKEDNKGWGVGAQSGKIIANFRTVLRLKWGYGRPKSTGGVLKVLTELDKSMRGVMSELIKVKRSNFRIREWEEKVSLTLASVLKS